MDADHGPSATTALLCAVHGRSVGELSDGLIRTLETVFERADHESLRAWLERKQPSSPPSETAVVLKKRKIRF